MRSPVNRIKRSVILVLSGLLALGCFSRQADAQKIKVLLIDGQNNHNWVETSPVIKDILEKTGRFEVEISTCPPKLPKKPDIKNEDMENPAMLAAWQEEVKLWEDEFSKAEKRNEEAWKKWNPDFYDYDVVVSNYNGQSWPAEVERNFEEYMKQGGGLVVIHAADNAFSDWQEYNKMIGVGGWGGRNEKSGPMLRYRDNIWVQDSTPGRGGMHGKKNSTLIINLKPNHPIMQGLPQKWMHVTDEIYAMLRGPAENITVLASSYSDINNGGTGEQEPGLMVINYHKGRVFHTVYGHGATQMQGLGFQITLQRGTEWAATNKVTLPLPDKKLSESVAVVAE